MVMLSLEKEDQVYHKNLSLELTTVRTKNNSSTFLNIKTKINEHIQNKREKTPKAI